MKARQLENLGIPHGEPIKAAIRACKAASKNGMGRKEIKETVAQVASNPGHYRDNRCFGELAALLVEPQDVPAQMGHPRRTAPYRIWGEGFEQDAVEQLKRACSLPVSVRGALMPDAHVGYGLPIGGVLATDGAVIPYAVGVDIACRMKMTVIDMPPSAIGEKRERLKQALSRETMFGVGAAFKRRRQHPVMDRDWSFSKILARLKDKAWDQLGSSGSGNHFVEFGILEVQKEGLSLDPGVYLALLSHSGSRGTGNEVATHYSKVARAKHAHLKKELVHLAWFGLDTHDGQEYWKAMHLMGEYASANHHLIHRAIARNLGVEVLLDIENHHNFAWKENHFGREVIVHRKGATPAFSGALGIIPGSMATPGFVVRGKGEPESLASASHGAGRKMSRRQAKQTFNWNDLMRLLKKQGVILISAGLDEAPMAYKDINEVMAYQDDLVEVLARFDPKIVRMAPGGERPED